MKFPPGLVPFGGVPAIESRSPRKWFKRVSVGCRLCDRLHTVGPVRYHAPMLYALGPSPLLLYAFSFRDPLTGRWIKARHREEHHVIARQYRETEWRIDGPPEIRGVDLGTFNPWRQTS